MGASMFWCFVIGSMVGVGAASVVPISVWMGMLGMAIACTACVLSFVWNEQRLRLLAVSVIVFAGCLGAWRMGSVDMPRNSIVDERVGSKATFEGRVVGEADVRESSMRVVLEADRFDEASLKDEVRLLVILPLHTRVEYGDRIRATGSLRHPESFETSPGRMFNYPAFLAKDGIGYELKFAQAERLASGESSVLKRMALAIKRTYLTGIGLSMPEPHAGLAGGITVGDKRGLGSELTDTFQVVGLTHIVVLSGYNIMVVVEAMRHVLRRFPSTVRLVFGIGTAIFFALITGFAAASTRAAAMASIAIVGRELGRTYLALRALGLVAFVMVMWNPYILSFDTGFQLSIVATAGLIALTPYVSAYLQRVPSRYGLRDIVASSIATQIAVAPLILYYIGAFSLVSLPANILALPVIPITMLFALIAGIAGSVLTPLAPLVALPAYLGLSYVIFVAETLAMFPFASIPVPPFSMGAVFVAYAALLGAYRFAERKNGRNDVLPSEIDTSTKGVSGTSRPVLASRDSGVGHTF